MKQTMILALLIVLLSSLSACRGGRGVLVYFETYWEDAMQREPAYRTALEREASRAGVALSFVSAPVRTNYFEDLRSAVRDKPSNLVIVSPLLANEAVRIAPLFPEKKFAVLDMPRLNADIPPNLIPVYAQRKPAFFEAGKITGAVIASGVLPQAGKKVGVVLSGLTRMEKELFSEFERGFSVHGDMHAVSTVELGTVTDRVKAVRAVVDLLNQDVRLFLIMAYGLNGACLEQVLGGGAYYIVSDASSFDWGKDKLFLSIEDDYHGLFTTLLRAADFSYPEPPVLSASVVRGALIKDFSEP